MNKNRYFGTDGIRGKVGGDKINPDFMLKLGWAVGRSLVNQAENPLVLIGKDTRISGYMFESAIEAGLLSAGVDVKLLGPMPTPAVAYLTSTLRAELGIVISASHNPHYDNGVKFFLALGRKPSEAWECAIEEKLLDPIRCVPSQHIGKASRLVGASDRYIEFCKGKVGPSISFHGLRVVIDCANGATYHIAPKVFAELGAEVIVMHAKPDGLNINHECGSNAADSLIERVKEARADCGMAFDGDGDRLLMVDAEGEVLGGDTLLYALVKQAKQQGDLNGGVVGTTMTGLGFEQGMAHLEVPFYRTQVGDRFVMQALSERKWVMGGEPSGHLMHLGEMHSADAIVAAILVLRVMHERNVALSELRGESIVFPQVLINIPHSSNSEILQADELNTLIRHKQKELGECGRVFLRASGTEPVLRVLVEGEDSEKIKHIANELAQYLIDKQ